MRALLGEAGVIDDPGGQRMFTRHGGQHLTANLPQQGRVAPGRLGHDVVQRLMHLAHVCRSQTRRHRLDALARNRQHQSLGVVLHRNHTISMPGSFCQGIQIHIKALSLTRQILLAKAHCFNLLPCNLPRQANQLEEYSL